MNTQAQVRSLEAGQALELSARASGPLVLAEGELLLQEPARWLAGRVVLPRPVRLVAPAVLEAAQDWSAVAVRASKVIVQERAPVLSLAKPLWLAARRLRAAAAGA